MVSPDTQQYGTFMQAATYVALSSQIALERQLDVVANNIANASTPSFKDERMLFAEYLNRKGSSPTSYVETFGTSRDTSQGPLARTGNPLDVALNGNGYIKVDTPFGTRYTRNGRLELDANGQLVNGQGYAVLGTGNQPINLPPDAVDISITRDGTISTKDGQAGQIEVVKFDNERTLRPVAGGLYVTDAQPTPAADTAVLQGMIEDSNVQPVIEMTRMMTVARSYTSAKDLIDSENDRIKTAITTLGKVA
jgi:flagellar basal-body rod protein FlgF